MDTEEPHLIQYDGSTDNTISVIINATTCLYFDLVGGAYQARDLDPDTLVTNSSTQEFVLTDANGNQIHFADFTVTPTAEQGAFKSFVDPYGNATSVASWTSDGGPAEVQRSTVSGGDTIHVVSQGTQVGCSGDSLVVRPRDQPETKHAIRGVEAVLVHGFAQLTTQAIRKCVEHGVGVHWMTVTGYHTASLTPTDGQVQRRIRQYRALADEATCLRLTKALVHAKVEGQHRYLLRATRGGEGQREGLLGHLTAIQQALRSSSSATDRDSLRGQEGTAAVHYFAGLRTLLGPQVPEDLRSETRNRRPPLDRFNALLSYGYGLLHTAVMRAVLASGLEPALGFFHTPRSAAYPLVLDLMELFRVTLGCANSFW